MNDNEQTQEQQDAAAIAEYREMVDFYIAAGQPGGYIGIGNHLRQAAAFDAAALRTIDAQSAELNRVTAERDALKQGVQQIIADCYESVRLAHYSDASRSDWAQVPAWRNVANDLKDVIRAALGNADQNADGANA